MYIATDKLQIASYVYVCTYIRHYICSYMQVKHIATYIYRLCRPFLFLLRTVTVTTHVIMRALLIMLHGWYIAEPSFLYAMAIHTYWPGRSMYLRIYQVTATYNALLCFHITSYLRNHAF